MENKKFFNQLVVGGAQLGMKYSGSNKLFRKKNEIKKIFKLGKKFGVNKVDTAISYGASEYNIGANKENKKIFIITKFDLKNFNKKNISLFEFLKKKLENSLKKLEVSKINILLIHRYKDLKKYDKKLITALKKLNKMGYFSEAGISIYNPNEFKFSLKHMYLKNIQIPFNIIDYRWLDPQIINLIKKNKVKIHVRSIFLKGLLINKKNSPKKFNLIMSKIHSKLNNYVLKFNKKNKLELCISYVKSFNWIKYFVFGFNNLKEFKEILKIVNETKKLLSEDVVMINKDMRSIIKDKKILSPNLWTN